MRLHGALELATSRRSRRAERQPRAVTYAVVLTLTARAPGAGTCFPPKLQERRAEKKSPSVMPRSISCYGSRAPGTSAMAVFPR